MILLTPLSSGCRSSPARPPSLRSTSRSVAEKHTPELTEEFAKSIGYDSLAAMRESIRAQKQKIHEEGADRAAGQRLLEMAGANIEVHIAPETLDRTADNEMKLLGERLSRSGLTVEQHCKNSHTTPGGPAPALP